jgi:hypothetical protein
MGKKGMSTSTSYRCVEGANKVTLHRLGVLKTFGGDMNIDDFRNMDNKSAAVPSVYDHRKSVCGRG